MTASEFFAKYNGKGIDFDFYYGFQCMDLWQQYNKEVFGGPHVPAPYAKDVWLKDLYPKNLYTKIPNTPTGIPQKGDVVIWSGAANGGPGHIALFYQGDVMKFTSFDQNWPTGSVCHFQPHNYNYVLGWLRPRVQQQSPADRQIEEIKTILGTTADSNTKVGRIKQVLGC